MNNIKLLRTQKKITQEKLSKLLGVSRSSISMWENEINEPDNATLIKMAQIFDTSIGYILGVEEDNESTGKEPEGKPEVTEHDIKVALFHGDKEVTDEMWKEVMDFAEMVALKYRYKKNGGNKS